MHQYPKIHSVFKRDEATNEFLDGRYSRPEFEYLANNPWEFTEKVDGTNIRIMVRAGDVTFAGKTDNASIPAKLFAKLVTIFLPSKEALLAQFPDGGCLYGEGYGPKIQSGGHYSLEPQFVLFDVKVGEWWLTRQGMLDVATRFDLRAVPLRATCPLSQMVQQYRSGHGHISEWGHFPAEGVVGVPTCSLRDRGGARVIVKIKARDFAARRAAP